LISNKSKQENAIKTPHPSPSAPNTATIAENQ